MTLRILGSDPIFYESFSELVVRWFGRQPEATRERIGGAPEATIRAEKRAELVMKSTGLKPGRLIKTPREWETRWDARSYWNTLSALVRERGWDVLLVDTSGQDADWSHRALGQTENQAIVITEDALHRQAETLIQHGCALPLTARDMAPLALAMELYSVESQRLGRAPVAWVEELARFEFARRVLGFPIHPMILSLLADRKAAKPARKRA